MAQTYIRFIVSGLLLAALMISGASAFAIIVHDAQVKVGSIANVNIEIDSIPSDLWFYKINLTNSNPPVGEFVGVLFPTWTTLTQNSTLPGDFLSMKGGALMSPVPAGTTNVSLGNFTVRGDAPGSSQIDLVVDSMETADGVLIFPSVVNGTLEVLPVNGNIQVDSTPAGAWIYLDNANQSVVTPATLSGITPGSHVVNVTLAGYRVSTEQPVDVAADGTAAVAFQLEPITPPVADFSASPTTGKEPLDVSFSDASANKPTTWFWEFGDGSTSIEQNPVHTFSAGTYTVNLTVANADGTDKVVKTDFINVEARTPPVADFTGSPTSGKEPLDVTFSRRINEYSNLLVVGVRRWVHQQRSEPGPHLLCRHLHREPHGHRTPMGPTRW